MYTHDDEESREISRVFYVQDEKRGQECVYAAGWNRKVYIWEDMDEVGFPNAPLLGIPYKMPAVLCGCIQSHKQKICMNL